MKPEFVKRIKFAALVFLVAIVCGYFLTAGTSSSVPEEKVRKVERPLLIEEMQSARIVIPDFERPISLVGGKAAFPLDENDAESGTGTVTLSPIYAHANGMQAGSDRAREYVFGVLTLEGGGNGVFSFLIMFEDDGRGLSYITSAYLGDRIQVLGLHIGGEWNDTTGDVRVKVRILDRTHGADMTIAPAETRIVQFRVHKANDTITKEEDE